MSKKNRRFWPQQQTPSTPPAETGDDDTPAPDPNAPAAGQVYDGVVMDDRPINIHGFRPGHVLGPIVLEAPYEQGDEGWWIASFVGESVTKVYVDGKMLATGKRIA